MLDNYRNMLLISLKLQSLSNLLLVDFSFFSQIVLKLELIFLQLQSHYHANLSPQNQERQIQQSPGALIVFWGFFWWSFIPPAAMGKASDGI